jgi:hypothetical protein
MRGNVYATMIEGKKKNTILPHACSIRGCLLIYNNISILLHMSYNNAVYSMNQCVTSGREKY